MKTQFTYRPVSPYGIVFILLLLFEMVIPALSQTFSIPAFFESDDYSNMSGVIVIPNTGPYRGGCLAWIEEGDWVEYQISVSEAGDYYITLGATSTCRNGSIKVLVDNVEQLELPVFYTGSWEYYVWFSNPDCLHLTAGEHTLRLQFYHGDPYIINIIELGISKDYYIHQEAEGYSAMDGIIVEESADTLYPGQNIGWIEEGDWVEYSITAYKTGWHRLFCRAATPNSDSYIKVFVNDQEQLEYPIYPTGSWASYLGFDILAEPNLYLSEGVNKIKFQFYNGAPYIVNLNFFTLGYISGINTNVQESIKLDNFSIYPNPIDDIVNINMPDRISEYTIEMFDILGNSLLFESKVGDGSINSSQLPTGLYYLVIYYEGRFVIRKVLKN